MTMSARYRSRASLAAATMREVLPSTSPTTRLSCAMTQRSCFGALKSFMNCPAVPIRSRKARYSELSLRAAQSENNNLNPSFDRTDRDPALSWRVLAVLNLYRVLVPLVLLGLYSLGGARGFAVYSAQLFFGATIFYLCFGLASVALVRRRMASANVQTSLAARATRVATIAISTTAIASCAA